MKKAILRRAALAALVALATGAGAIGADALPRLDEGVGQGSLPITHVAEGCGAGEHRGPLGRCLPNEGRPVVEPRACPRGFHLGPRERDCVRN